jgi:hypothetical protein
MWANSVISKKPAQSKQPSKRRKFAQSGHLGTDVVILKIFSQKIWPMLWFLNYFRRILAFCPQNTASLCKKDHYIGFLEKRQFRKLGKIVIITSALGPLYECKNTMKIKVYIPAIRSLLPAGLTWSSLPWSATTPTFRRSWRRTPWTGRWSQGPGSAHRTTGWCRSRSEVNFWKLNFGQIPYKNCRQ